jgi:hypothetical protein
MTDLAFEAFPKIARLRRDCVITEKLDGTNAQIVIRDGEIVAVGSRTRWITPGKDTDNFGFAGWVRDNADALKTLGDGTHFGEWWGSGIQRSYGLTEKRFSLFNVGRWRSADLPACVGLVPVLYEGAFSSEVVDAAMNRLRTEGSIAAPGFMKPEGIIVYHAAARQLFKVTLEKDDEPKSRAA